MGLLRSILLLAGAACSVSFALFVGHALAVHTLRPALLGTALLAVGAALLALYTRGGNPAAGPHS